jgi:hypothetical protein
MSKGTLLDLAPRRWAGAITPPVEDQVAPPRAGGDASAEAAAPHPPAVKARTTERPWIALAGLGAVVCVGGGIVFARRRSA